MYQSNETTDRQHAPPSVVLLYTILHKVVLSFESLDKMSVTNQMKSTEQYFPVELLIMLYKVVLIFQSMGEILKRDHLNERYSAVHVLSSGTVYYTAQCGSNF